MLSVQSYSFQKSNIKKIQRLLMVKARVSIKGLDLFRRTKRKSVFILQPQNKITHNTTNLTLFFFFLLAVKILIQERYCTF